MTQRLLIYSYASCVALAIGSLGPWFTGPVSYSGASGDGILTLSGAGLAALVIWRWTASRRRLMLIIAQVVAALCAAVAFYGISAFYIDGGRSGADRVGWGLILAFVTAIALTTLCFLQYRRTASGGS